MQTGRVIDAKSGTVKPPVALRFGPVALRFGPVALRFGPVALRFGNARPAGASAKRHKIPVAFKAGPAYTATNLIGHIQPATFSSCI